MNALETIVIIVIVIIIGMTIISEPKVCLEFGKAMFKSGIRFVAWIKDVTVKTIDAINQSEVNSTDFLKGGIDNET